MTTNKPKSKNKHKKKSCKHKRSDINECNACGHTEEYCFDCGKSRCSENDKFINIK